MLFDYDAMLASGGRRATGLGFQDQVDELRKEEYC